MIKLPFLSSTFIVQNNERVKEYAPQGVAFFCVSCLPTLGGDDNGAVSIFINGKLISGYSIGSAGFKDNFERFFTVSEGASVEVLYKIVLGTKPAYVNISFFA